jgi:membrane protease YdiL (CAAX protease family)
MQPPRIDSPPERLGVQSAAARATAIGVLALCLEWARAMAARQHEIALVSLVVGGVALGALGLGFTAHQLGLTRSRLAFRLLGGLVLGAVLLLPSAVRGSPLPLIPAPFAVAAVGVSVGEEIAFRGALFAAIESWLGPGAAILGSSLVFAAGHLLSHPPQFLLAVTAMGLLLAVWRWACGDLVAPIVAHCIADLAL